MGVHVYFTPCVDQRKYKINSNLCSCFLKSLKMYAVQSFQINSKKSKISIHLCTKLWPHTLPSLVMSSRGHVVSGDPHPPPPKPTLPPPLCSLVPGHPSNWRSLYGLPSPWQLLPLATITAAVVEVKKLVLAPTLAVKAVCVFAVCRAVTDIIVRVVCVCVYVGNRVFSFGSRKAPMLLADWLHDWPRVWWEEHY